MIILLVIYSYKKGFEHQRNRIQRKKKVDVSEILVSLYNLKNRIKISNVFEQNGSQMKHFKSLNEMTSMRCCISGLSNREVTMYHSVVFFS